MSLSTERRQELLAIVALLVGLFVGLALLPLGVTGPVGRFVGHGLREWVGAGSVVFPIFGVLAALVGFGWLRGISLSRLAILSAGCVILLPYAIALLAGGTAATAFPPDYAQWSLAERMIGLLPALFVVGISALIGTAGAVVVGIIALSGLTLATFDWHPFGRLKRGEEEGAGWFWRKKAGGAEAAGWQGGRVVGEVDDEESGAGSREQGAGNKEQGAGSKERETGSTEQGRGLFGARRKVQGARRKGDPRGRAQRGGADALDQLPPLDLMDAPSREAIDAGESELERLGEVLVDTLATFRVEGKIVGRTTGPVVTQYEVAPGSGVKVGRIAALADDLALAMRAQSIRIVAPIPGKAAVGVEVPNPTPRIVRLRELLDAPEWDRTRAGLPIALGKNLEGEPVIADLTKMPHLLIAGATGSGKSVCINTIVTSLVYRYTPRELRLLMIDPKMVELVGYNVLPHLRHPVVTNNRQAAQTLKWAVHEMERRYELFSANGARNIGDFNRKVADGREMVLPEKAQGAGRREQGAGGDGEQGSLDLQLPYEEGALPYIVLIVDELADLMMTVQGEVEKPLAMLAQKARATGIHLILATQRPSVNVITGLIKANFPSRIAFRVASKVDSRTILDQNGAEALLGNGDMLFLPPGKSEPVRVQGAFISTEETETVTDWYAEQKRRRDEALAAAGLPAPEGREEDILAVVAELEAAEAAGAAGAIGGAEGAEDRDPLFRDAAEVCLQNQLGSTSLLQRKLRIGYGRAARIIDQLYEAGVLGPPDGSKPREVLIGAEQLDEYCG